MTIRSEIPWLAASLLLAASSAFAQTPSPSPTAQMDSVPEKIAPGAKPTEPAKNLSEKLNASNGVIHPKEVDPGIEKPAPQAHDPNVIPAPGAQGGGATPQPK